MSKQQKRTIWIAVLVTLGVCLIFAIMYVNGQITTATDGSSIHPGLGKYKVLQSHENGRILQVEHNGRIIVLTYVSMDSTNPDAEIGPYPYEAGEVLTLQLLCHEKTPYFYKELEDGTGERKYDEGFVWDSDTCK